MCTLDDFQEQKNDTGIFSDGEYLVYSEKINELKTGDIIYLTTSEFMYDCIYACFMKDIRRSARVKVKILLEDLSEFVPGKCVNGGCYGFASAEVLEILK